MIRVKQKLNLISFYNKKIRRLPDALIIIFSKNTFN